MKNQTFNLSEMQKRVDEEHKRQAAETRKNLDKMTERAIRDQDEVNELFAKSVKSDQQDLQRQYEQAVAAIKARSEKEIAALQDEYENKGLPSPRRQAESAPYKSLLEGLKQTGK